MREATTGTYHYRWHGDRRVTLTLGGHPDAGCGTSGSGRRDREGVCLSRSEKMLNVGQSGVSPVCVWRTNYILASCCG